MASFASLVVCPLVGAASDFTAHAWGRRRIYMLTFLPVACGGLVLLAYSDRLGAWLGDIKEEQNYALVLAIVGLMVRTCEQSSETTSSVLAACRTPPTQPVDPPPLSHRIRWRRWAWT